MNKQTHSEETLKRTKGIIGDEDKHKSSTENPEKELSFYDSLNIIFKDMSEEEIKEIFEIKNKYRQMCTEYLANKLNNK